MSKILLLDYSILCPLSLQEFRKMVNTAISATVRIKLIFLILFNNIV